jgi:MYXO-CTERM domain-containing protein
MDSCDPVMGCVNEPTVGCCLGDEDCGADETCDLDSNTCVPLPSDSSAGESSGPGDTGLDGTGTSGGDSGVAGSETGNVDTGLGGSTGDLTTGASAEVPTPETPTGCACTTDRLPRGEGWWLMMIAGLLVRRRRSTPRA